MNYIISKESIARERARRAREREKLKAQMKVLPGGKDEEKNGQATKSEQ